MSLNEEDAKYTQKFPARSKAYRAIDSGPIISPTLTLLEQIGIHFLWNFIHSILKRICDSLRRLVCDDFDDEFGCRRDSSLILTLIYLTSISISILCETTFCRPILQSVLHLVEKHFGVSLDLIIAIKV